MNRETGRRTALVTGAGGGIGAAIARAFARAGMDVVVNDLGCTVEGNGASDQPAHGTAALVRNAGVVAIVDGSDVSDPEQMDTLRARLAGAGVVVDALVNTAGILRSKMIYNLSDDDWYRVQQVHLQGPFVTMRTFIPPMLEQGFGRVVNFSSTAGLYGTFGASNYSAAKAAVTGLTRSVAAAVYGMGVTVNAVSPFAETRMGDASRPVRSAGGPPRVNPLELNIQSQRVQLPEERRPEHVAAAVVSLCSEGLGDVNGEVFIVSGTSVSLVEEPRVEMMIENQAGWSVHDLERYLPVLAGAR